VLGITNGLIQRQNKSERTPGPSPNPVPVGDKGAISIPIVEQSKHNTANLDLDPAVIL
jgi:hypothetical protein